MIAQIEGEWDMSFLKLVLFVILPIFVTSSVSWSMYNCTGSRASWSDRQWNYCGPEESPESKAKSKLEKQSDLINRKYQLNCGSFQVHSIPISTEEDSAVIRRRLIQFRKNNKDSYSRDEFNNFAYSLKKDVGSYTSLNVPGPKMMNNITKEENNIKKIPLYTPLNYVDRTNKEGQIELVSDMKLDMYQAYSQYGRFVNHRQKAGEVNIRFDEETDTELVISFIVRPVDHAGFPRVKADGITPVELVTTYRIAKNTSRSKQHNFVLPQIPAPYKYGAVSTRIESSIDKATGKNIKRRFVTEDIKENGVLLSKFTCNLRNFNPDRSAENKINQQEINCERDWHAGPSETCSPTQKSVPAQENKNNRIETT